MKPDNRVREVKRPTTVPVNVLSPIHAPVPVHGPVSAHVLLSALLLVILLLITGLSLHSQTYPFLEYTSDDGLPQTQSTSVMQDSRGYLWIPTRNGLARFDGHTFNSYLRKDGLPSNLITKVIEDKGGIIV